MRNILLVLSLVAAVASAQISSFKAPEKMMADGKAIGISTAFADYSEGALSPSFFDYDGDGDLDLLLGTFADPRLIWFENIGTKTNPDFTEKKMFTLDNGSPLVASNF